jgi:hypothetical protein
MYLLYSTRNNGWLTRSSTYSTDLIEAVRHERETALAMVKRHKEQAGYPLLPIREEDLV